LLAPIAAAAVSGSAGGLQSHSEPPLRYQYSFYFGGNTVDETRPARTTGIISRIIESLSNTNFQSMMQILDI
jgi:hypothetical protein